MDASCLGPAALTALLLLLTPVPGGAFISSTASLSLSTLAHSREASSRLHQPDSAWGRSVGGAQQLRERCAGRRSGVASLRAEVLPEGGVSPCVIKVSCDLPEFFACGTRAVLPPQCRYTKMHLYNERSAYTVPSMSSITTESIS